MLAAPGHEQIARPDGDTALLVPGDDVEDPEFSIVVPALNEEITIGRFVDWCREGISRAGVAGERSLQVAVSKIEHLHCLVFTRSQHVAGIGRQGKAMNRRSVGRNSAGDTKSMNHDCFVGAASRNSQVVVVKGDRSNRTAVAE